MPDPSIASIGIGSFNTDVIRETGWRENSRKFCGGDRFCGGPKFIFFVIHVMDEFRI